MADIAFALNYTNLFMIDITPSAAAPTWARVGAGINSFTDASTETVADDAYYDGEGMAFTDITGGQIVHQFAGHRKYGDPAQDFIESIATMYGSSRKTSYKVIKSDGTIITGSCTIANIVTGGGDPNAKGTFSFEVRMNGRPSVTAGNKDDFPTSITVTAVSVTVGASTAASVTVSPATAAASYIYAIEDESKATVDANGTVTGVAAGSTKLLVKSAVLPTISGEATVTVSV